MSTLILRAMFRKKGTTSSILAIALLIAILASVNAVVNHLNLQADVLGRLVNPSRTYIIISGNSITDSKVSIELVHKLSNFSYFNYVLPQKMLTINITMNSSSYTIQARGVSDVGIFLKIKRAYLNGTAAKNWTEVNAGEILARLLSINVGDFVDLALGDKNMKVRIAGIFRSQTQSDTELIMPMETANSLSGNDTISLIELSLKESVNSQEAISKILQLLPENVKLVQVQQLKEFLQQMNTQTLEFLNVWSLAVYAVVAVASYIIATRLISESTYELSMLRALGAKKNLIFATVLSYTLTIAFLGSILGISLGIVGVQIASTFLRWIDPSVDIAPFLKMEQAIQALILTFASSFLGCIYPALKSAQTKYVEQL